MATSARRQPRDLVLAGDVDAPVLLVLGGLAVDLEAAALAHDPLEVPVPLPVGGGVLEPGADVGLRGRVEPLARALRQREACRRPARARRRRRGSRTAGACPAACSAELLGDASGCGGPSQQRREHAEPLRDADDAPGGHPVQRIAAPAAARGSGAIATRSSRSSGAGLSFISQAAYSRPPAMRSVLRDCVRGFVARGDGHATGRVDSRLFLVFSSVGSVVRTLRVAVSITCGSRGRR